MLLRTVRYIVYARFFWATWIPKIEYLILRWVWFLMKLAHTPRSGLQINYVCQNLIFYFIYISSAYEKTGQTWTPHEETSNSESDFASSSSPQNRTWLQPVFPAADCKYTVSKDSVVRCRASPCLLINTSMNTRISSRCRDLVPFQSAKGVGIPLGLPTCWACGNSSASGNQSQERGIPLLRQGIP